MDVGKDEIDNMILQQIAEETVRRVREEKEICSLSEMKRKAEKPASKEQFKIRNREPFLFQKILATEGFHFICEVKKASPSKGVIASEFPYLEIAKEYEAAGAACISVLTEPNHFQGRKEYLKEISETVTIPVLRKDFIVDEYQIYEAKLLGATAVLLIAALLDEKKLRGFLKICNELMLSALVETHDDAEIQIAVNAGASLIGINNRNLNNFQVDINNCIRLRPLIPDGITVVAESGIETAEDIQRIHSAGISAVLIGETMMRCTDKKDMLKKLRGDC